MLKVENLSVDINQESILKNISFTLESGQIQVLTGPNGSGKSTLVQSLAGHSALKITSGKLILDGEDLSFLPTEERLKKGLFISFQNPVDIPGISLATLLKESLAATSGAKPNLAELIKEMKAWIQILDLPENFYSWDINAQASGGQKKKSEILQMLILKPKFAILDEIDSGLDQESLHRVFKAILEFQKQTKTGIFWITHSPRILSLLPEVKLNFLIKGELITHDSQNSDYDRLSKSFINQ